ncbi:hypothetical protein K470DRAFT_296371 [Piedraia hortae CBS 480.64]|uniref:Myb-like domain-containing protein n=1 Tax=Piedraia hortae CBS 480.64 TaxID=1314780 RepID=A0A6A7BUT9_9PEZI|nr:hypothetical protein K470DRAFT_296371 [Piedraia hortae CBS 480.64]
MGDPSPWTNHEKNELLAEIIKVSEPHPTKLFDFIVYHQIQPRWPDTPLPRGRTLYQCQTIYDEFVRRFPGTAPSHVHAAPYQGWVPSNPYKFPGHADPSLSGGREIRPKPLPPQHTPPLASEPLNKRKRGRPTKLEAQAKASVAEAAAAAAAAAAAQEQSLTTLHSQPRSGYMASQSSSLYAPSAAVAGGPAVRSPSASKMPISAVLTPQPSDLSVDHGSPSGKRRRTRFSRSSPEGSLRSHRPGGSSTYQSPYVDEEAEVVVKPASALGIIQSDRGASQKKPETQSTEPHEPEPPPDPLTQHSSF